MASHETIAALATPPGSGGIGVLRLSGSKALAIGETLCKSKLKTGLVQFRRFFDADNEMLDHGICLYFKAPSSFSGEDCVEIQAHGGPIVLDMLLERLCELGARLARPGEFSERAFLNGKLDLTQAEAIADLIESGSRAASRAAVRSLEGRFSQRVHKLVDEIIDLRAFIEAALDFAEEEIDFLDNPDVRRRLDLCNQHLEELLGQAEQGRTLQEGMSISLAGLPNAGKSSLLNYLAGYEAAIVTEIEGTTRDVLREHISLKGIPLKVHDTAGLRESQNPVEKEGVRRAWETIEQADVIIYLVDSSKGLSNRDQENIDKLASSRLQVVFSKSDLLEADQQRDPDRLTVSTLSGVGMETLIQRITGRATDYNQDNQAFMARRRHVDALLRARDSVLQAVLSFSSTQSGELIAEDLREAQRHLNEITGEFTSDDLLGKIFSTFCIGK
jgi:tRNA modification GTPase